MERERETSLLVRSTLTHTHADVIGRQLVVASFTLRHYSSVSRLNLCTAWLILFSTFFEAKAKKRERCGAI